jgi:hypothetical protein
VLHRTCLDGVLLSVPGSDALLWLDPPGDAIWALIGSGVDHHAQLVDELVVAFPDASKEQISIDVSRFLDDLHERGIIEQP